MGIQDSSASGSRDELLVQISDPVTGNKVDLVFDGGIWKIPTTADVVSNIAGLGKDPLPDTFFTVTNAGAIGDTVRVQIAGTSNDTSSPDRDLPAVDKTTTLTASEVGNEQALAELITSDLNNDTNFQDAFLEAEAIAEDGDDNKRAIVHISSIEFSLSGEFHERSTNGDVAVSVTGTTTVTLNSDLLIARSKEVTLDRDPNNPHKSGILGITGQVRVRADEVDEILEEFATESGGGTDLTLIDGSVTPVEYTIIANTGMGAKKKIIESVKIYGDDTNIKVGQTKFLGTGAALTNGIDIEVIKDGTMITFRNIKNTNDILARHATSPADATIINQSGGDYINGTFDLVSRNIQLVLEPNTTDKIIVRINDALTSVGALFYVADGFQED